MPTLTVFVSTNYSGQVRSGNGTIVVVASWGEFYGGRAGSDTFVYGAVTDSAAGQGEDVIVDFTAADMIDLSGLDAIAGGGDDAFKIVGQAAFSGAAGELRLEVLANAVWVEGDVTGDGQVDFRIILDGSFVPLDVNFLA